MSAPDSSPTLPPTPEPAPARRSRRPWLVALPVFALVLIAVGWSAAWFYAAGRADREIDQWIANEAQQGRVWSCADRALGGFPFRFELMCGQPTVTFSDGAGEWRWSAARAHAVAQVWNPRHIIAEFQGPAHLTQAATGRQIEATWSLMQISGTGAQGQVERSSVAANDYALSEGGQVLFGARHLEFHVRHHPSSGAAPALRALDLAASVTGAHGMALATLAGGTAPSSPPTSPAPAAPPVDGALQVTVTGVPEFRAMPAQERLLLWQQAGGRVKVEVAQLSAGGGTLAANGEVGLDTRRRPDGMLTVSLSNAPALLNALSQAGLMPDFMVNFAPILGAAGLPTTVDGAPASSFPFVFRDGRVALGILPLGKIGPLF